MNKPKYTIAVTGLNAIDSPGSGLAVIKGLRESESFDVRIIGLSYESMEPLIYLHQFVDKTYQIPFPYAGQEVLWQRLEYINLQENIDIIFPNFDAELLNFINLKDKLESELKIKMILPSKNQFEERQKINLYQFGQKYNILVPISKQSFSIDEALSFSADLGYPLAVKGKFYDAKIAYTVEDISQHFSRIAGQWGTPIIIQQFIEGTELNVSGIGDGQGNTLGAVAMKKIYITDKGKAWSGITINDNSLLDICHQFVRESKWAGAFELEFIKTSSDKYYLLEINPRFPAWYYLCVGAGQNHTETLVNLALGKKYKTYDSYQIGKMFVRYSNDIIIGLKEFEAISTTGEL